MSDTEKHITKYARSPWFLEIKGRQNHGIIKSALGEWIAQVGYVNDELYSHRRVDGKYNAHLMKAAPKLHKALENAPIPCEDETAEEFMKRYCEWLLQYRSKALKSAEPDDE